jgi:hypothetical protein
LTIGGNGGQESVDELMGRCGKGLGPRLRIAGTGGFGGESKRQNAKGKNTTQKSKVVVS